MKPVELYVQASGRRANPEAFARVVTAAAMLSRPQSSIVDEGFEAEPEQLLLTDLPGRGRFRVEAIYAAGEISFGWAREDIILRGKSRRVMLPRPEGTWGADRVMIRLLSLDSLGVEAEKEYRAVPLAIPLEFQSARAQAVALPGSKAGAARRFGDEHPEP